MSVLRELAVKIGYQVDAQQWRQAQENTERLKRSMQGLEQASARASRAGGGVARGGSLPRASTGGAAALLAGSAVSAGGAALAAPGLLSRLGRGVSNFFQAPGAAAWAQVTTGRASRGGGGGGAFGGLGGAAAAATRPVNMLGASVNNLQANLMRLGLGIGFGAVIKGMIGLASDANETDNVLEQV